MRCAEIIRKMEQFCPVSAALEWDNVGLLAGREDKEVKKIYVALDATDEVIEEAAENGADMLITHHPLIFAGMKCITDQDFIGSRVLKLLQKDISYYAMHTNYDVKKMGMLACGRLHMEETEVLEVTHICEDGTKEGIGRIADISAVTLNEMCTRVKAAFCLRTVKVFGELNSEVRRIAVCPGSGKSVIDEAVEKGADVLITGDIGHHEGLDAQARGLSVIDAGHYGLEHIFIGDMKQYLEEHLREVKVQAAAVRHPFTVL